MIPIFARVQELEDKQQPAVLCTVVESKGSTPRKPGSRMIVHPDGSIEGTVGGGALEKKVIAVALEALNTGDAQLIHISLRENEPTSVGGICGGELRVFVEPIGSLPRLLIFGAGHVGCTLAHTAQHLDLSITVYDDRADQLIADKFPPRTRLVCGEFGKAMETVQPTTRDYVAIMSYKFTHDTELLNDALKTPAKYIGMIGSDVKCMRVLDDLKKRGVPQDQLDRVHAPIGESIGAHTPAEVAISILAQIVKVMNGI